MGVKGSQGTQSYKGNPSQRLTLDEMRHNKGPVGNGAQVPGSPLPCFFFSQPQKSMKPSSVLLV